MKKLVIACFLTIAVVGINPSFAGFTAPKRAGVDPTSTIPQYQAFTGREDDLKAAGQAFCVYCGKKLRRLELRLQCPNRVEGFSHSRRQDPNGKKKASEVCHYCKGKLSFNEAGELLLKAQCPQRKAGFACSPGQDPEGESRVKLRKGDSGKDPTVKKSKKHPSADMPPDYPEIPEMPPLDGAPPSGIPEGFYQAWVLFPKK
ncbi:MAG: hypothetical protein LBE97_00080 [Holosporales bacterium]|jgi:hypothetical protein|nr:hypothetical protein [Holosporales bacterium]